MAYTDKSKVLDEVGEDLLIQLTDRDELGIVDDDLLGSAMEKADSIINGFLATAMTLPLTAPYPETIVSIATDLTVYLLFNRIMNIPESWQRRYEDSLNYLRLFLSSPSPIPGTGAEVSGTDPVYYAQTENLMKDMLDELF